MDSKILLTLIALLGLSTYMVSQHSTGLNQDALVANEFTQWQIDMQIIYTPEELDYRFEVFKNNYYKVQKFNAEQTGSLRLGMTVFAGMTNEEFKQKMTMQNIPAHTQSASGNDVNYKPSATLPPSIDWVSLGAVTPVSNQGQCGSCWAFSTKESLEGIYQIRSKSLVTFSAEQLVDCAQKNYGCGGGWPLVAMQYTQEKGIMTEKSYPYVSGTGWETPCTYREKDVVFRNTGQQQVSPSNNAAAIQENVVRQPLSILVSAEGDTWQLYKSGVMDNTSCSTQTDHAVLLVGYDNEADTPYWKVKNSWGASWGESGYCQVMIEQNGPGVCGIQQSVYYPEYNN